MPQIAPFSNIGKLIAPKGIEIKKTPMTSFRVLIDELQKKFQSSSSFGFVKTLRAVCEIKVLKKKTQSKLRLG